MTAVAALGFAVLKPRGATGAAASLGTAATLCAPEDCASTPDSTTEAKAERKGLAAAAAAAGDAGAERDERDTLAVGTAPARLEVGAGPDFDAGAAAAFARGGIDPERLASPARREANKRG